MDDGFEQVLRERLPGAGAHEAMRELPCERNHFGDNSVELLPIQGELGERGEINGVLGLEQEPLEIGEKSLRMLVYCSQGPLQLLGIVTGKARGREALH